MGSGKPIKLGERIEQKEKAPQGCRKKNCVKNTGRKEINKVP